MANYLATEHDINLSVLQQKDPYIVGIADSASQVAAYSFNALTSEWEKTNVEGTLFVYTRSAFPINGFMIINRLRLNDLIEPINRNLEFQLQDPFLLYKNSQSESIYGIWFYDRDECARIGQLMNSLVQVAIETQNQDQSRQRRASESDSSVVLDRMVGGEVNANQMSSSQKTNVDILQLLSKAQDEYDKSKVQPPRKLDGTAYSDLNKMPTKAPQFMNGDLNTFVNVKTIKQQPQTTSSLNKQVLSNNNATNLQHQGFDSLTAFSQGQPVSNIQHPTPTHISLDTLFKTASKHQHKDQKTADQKFAPGGPNSAFHLPPPPLPTLVTPTVEEIEKAHRESNMVGSGGSAMVGSGGSSSSNGLAIRCGSDSSFSESSCEGSSLNIGRNKSRIEGGLDLKELHMQLMGQGHHQTLESPNTALKRTLNIAPVQPASTKPTTEIPQTFNNEIPLLHSNHHNHSQQIQKDLNSNNKQTSTNTLVQALFLREQQHQMQHQHTTKPTPSQNIVSRSTSTAENVNNWINKSNFPSIPVRPPVASQAASTTQLNLQQKLQSTPSPTYFNNDHKVTILHMPVQSTTKSTTQPTTTTVVSIAHSNTNTTAGSQLITNKQRQTTSRPVSDMLSKPNNFLTCIKHSGPSPVPTTTLLSPMVFQSTRNNILSQKLNQQSNIPGTTQTSTLVNTLMAPLTTHQLHNSTNVNKVSKQVCEHMDEKDVDTKMTPLTKEQLKQALITLLKNDVQFLTDIHEAYTASLNRGLTSYKK